VGDRPDDLRQWWTQKVLENRIRTALSGLVSTAKGKHSISSGHRPGTLCKVNQLKEHYSFGASSCARSPTRCRWGRERVALPPASAPTAFSSGNGSNRES